MVDLSQQRPHRSRGPNRRTRKPLINAYVPGELSSAEEMSLWLGDPSDGIFPSPEARKAAWFERGDDMIGRLPGSPGRQPMAWWQYSAPEKLRTRWAGRDFEPCLLYLGSELAVDEEALVVSGWYDEFKRARWRPPAERQAILECIPAGLVEVWQREIAATPVAAKPS